MSCTLWFNDKVVEVIETVGELDRALRKIRVALFPPNPILSLVHANANITEFRNGLRVQFDWFRSICGYGHCADIGINNPGAWIRSNLG